MQRLWLFNPENDIALASGKESFTAPAAALHLKKAGEMLPFFLASDDDAVACGGVSDRWFSEFRSIFSIKADVWNHDPDAYSPSPWGWSRPTRLLFEHLGFPKEKLPSDAVLDRYRRLSHRRTAISVGDCLARSTNLKIWPRAVEATDEAFLRHLLTNSGSVVVKQPWSSSGRGIRFFDAAKNNVDTFVGQTAGSIRRQGSVMVERTMHGHYDFALLFNCTDGEARHCGPSVGISDSHNGNYIGNIVGDDSFLLARLHPHISADRLSSLVYGLSKALTEVVADEYDGPVGVDICVAGNPDDPDIHICELNLRFTMGFVARGIGARISSQAILSVGSAPLSPGAISLTQPGTDIKFALTPL